jgi:nicotinamide-nucleotide amidase
VAGPAGGTPEKPVGTVWIGIAGPDTAYAKLFRFGTNRLRNIQNASLFAFNELRKSIEGFRD